MQSLNYDKAAVGLVLFTLNHYAELIAKMKTQLKPHISILFCLKKVLNEITTNPGLAVMIILQSHYGFFVRHDCMLPF